jgi:hypothetical protein
LSQAEIVHLRGVVRQDGERFEPILQPTAFDTLFTGEV